MSRRTREIGICLALDAGPGMIRRQVLWEILLLVLSGIAIRVPLAARNTSRAEHALSSGLRRSRPIVALC